MEFSIYITDSLPQESYSRQLDNNVARQEKPYGYTNEPPPADTGDFDQSKLESKKQYPQKNRW